MCEVGSHILAGICVFWESFVVIGWSTRHPQSLPRPPGPDLTPTSQASRTNQSRAQAFAATEAVSQQEARTALPEQVWWLEQQQV